METGLRHRVAIVAAASSGLGFACAKALAAEGAKLAICSRDEKRINAAADKLRGQTDVFAEAVDVTSPTAIQSFVRNVVAKFGRIDICITNAGGPPAKQFLATTNDEWQKAVAANFLSVVYFAKEVIPHMQKNRWGRFLAITSVSVKQPIGDLIYSNSVRPAVVGLTKSLANEFGKDGILVNNVGPGYTATDRLKDLAAMRSKATGASEQELWDRWAADTAVKRVGTPEEFANVVVFLASELASNVTGQTILVDGGSYRGLM